MCLVQVTKVPMYLTIFLSLSPNGQLPGKLGLAGFIGAKDDERGGNCSCKTCKAPVKISPSENQQPPSYRSDALPVALPTMSKH